MHTNWVYILTSKPYGTLYIGVTNNLLVHYEAFGNVEQAIQREKTLKPYLRQWKINLIERETPHWRDLYPALLPLPGNRTESASGGMGPRDKPEDDNG
ncbi:MAG: GIY-YIG nuclease family protein [Hyphomicrobiaceae bacterium]